jgi:hypothetical protein
MTTIPAVLPVATPTLLLGHFDHHAWILRWLVVASLKPCRVLGYFSAAWHRDRRRHVQTPSLTLCMATVGQPSRAY